jgi:hypothetical protein
MLKRFAVLLVLVLLAWTSSDAVADTCPIRISAWIDGRSQLILKGNTAQWHHLEANAPGREGGVTEPTIINGVDWFPVWPGDPGDPLNHSCNCFSDVFDGVNPPLPSQDMTVVLREIQVRQEVSVIQQPSAANDYTLIIEFNDNQPGGAAWYTVEFDVPGTCSGIPTLNQWGMIILSLLVAASALWLIRRRKQSA